MRSRRTRRRRCLQHRPRFPAHMAIPLVSHTSNRFLEECRPFTVCPRRQTCHNKVRYSAPYTQRRLIEVQHTICRLDVNLAKALRLTHRGLLRLYRQGTGCSFLRKRRLRDIPTTHSTGRSTTRQKAETSLHFQTRPLGGPSDHRASSTRSSRNRVLNSHGSCSSLLLDLQPIPRPQLLWGPIIHGTTQSTPRLHSSCHRARTHPSTPR